MFTSLLSQSFQYFKAHKRQYLIAVALLGTVTALEQWVMFNHVISRTAQHMYGPGVDPQEIYALQERADAGDAEAVVQLDERLAGMQAQLEALPEDQREAYVWGQAMKAMWSALPAIALHMLLYFVLFQVAMIAFLVLAINPAGLSWRRIMDLFFPMLGVSIWSFLRSFVWIPIIGIIPAVILYPRFAFSPVVLIREGTGVRASVDQSYRRTKGKWGAIVLNLFLAGLVLGLITWALGLVLNIFLDAGTDLFAVQLWASSVINAAGVALMCIFLVKLSGKLMKPMAPVKAKATKTSKRR